jgi:hypothetical protein
MRGGFNFEIGNCSRAFFNIASFVLPFGFTPLDSIIFFNSVAVYFWIIFSSGVHFSI